MKKNEFRVNNPSMIVPDVRFMTNKQIKYSLYLNRSSERSEINGYSLPFWELSLIRELEYRKALEETIIDHVSGVREKINEITYNIKWKK